MNGSNARYDFIAPENPALAKATPLDAAMLGAWIHGYAGDALTKEYTAEDYSSRELIDYIKHGFSELFTKPHQ